MATLSAIATAVFLVLFVGISWWASKSRPHRRNRWWAISAHRRAANAESAMLPFMLPDEAEVAGARAEASRPHQ